MKLLFSIILLMGSAANAHGPVAEQAMKAVQNVTAQFLAQEKPEITKQFDSVSAAVTGDEKFVVKVSLKGGELFEYMCGLDTAVKPVKWGCKKI